MSSVYEIFADGRKVGMCVAANATNALKASRTAMTRRTDSKIDVSCDYKHIAVHKLIDAPLPMGATLFERFGCGLFTENNAYLPRMRGVGEHQSLLASSRYIKTPNRHSSRVLVMS